ncbi:aminoglycoside phosphotransferase [Halogeometricum sp. CBA1124]|uniref:aminoglycoside phosphotransferase n=1 Tax=Halogeometricum sp. CBA1124 TaxID=2668071 RepID=UPI00142B90F7|nr:aminoglycoside phosphotransferase [Halogeometricum sp. CBA1124]MUV56399.1 aminoglycoside phosphotransferase [Halogeometricum sp. CBA1124]
MSQNAESESETSGLAKLRLGFQVLYSAVFVVLFVGVGAAPGNWNLPFGVAFAAFTVYWAFRDDVERRLSRPQEWAVFAFAVCGVLLGIAVERGELTDGVLLGFGGAVGVAVLFGYRAVERR